MANYSTFTRANLDSLKSEVLDALKVLEANGLRFETDGCTFNDHSCTLKVVIKNRDPRTDFMAKLGSWHNEKYVNGDLNRPVKMINLGDYLNTFVYKKKTYQVTGLDWNSKFAVETTCLETGKSINFTPACYCEAIGRTF